jgi:hypothetical protein
MTLLHFDSIERGDQDLAQALMGFMMPGPPIADAHDEHHLVELPNEQAHSGISGGLADGVVYERVKLLQLLKVVLCWLINADIVEARKQRLNCLRCDASSGNPSRMGFKHRPELVDFLEINCGQLLNKRPASWLNPDKVVGLKAE